MKLVILVSGLVAAILLNEGLIETVAFGALGLTLLALPFTTARRGGGHPEPYCGVCGGGKSRGHLTRGCPGKFDQGGRGS